MNKIQLKEINYKGISIKVPEVWKSSTEEFREEDGTKSYSLSISAKGKDVRSIDINLGVIPKGSDAYMEACATYLEAVGEDPENEEPIISFDLRGSKAYGFNIWTEGGFPCFFFCVDLKGKEPVNMMTVLVCASDNDELKDMMDFVEEYLIF